MPREPARAVPGPREDGGGAWSPGGAPWLRRLVAVVGMWILRRRGTRASRVPGKLPAPLGAGKGRIRVCVKGRGRRGLRSERLAGGAAAVGWLLGGELGWRRCRMRTWGRLVRLAAVFPGPPDSGVAQDEGPLTRGKDLELGMHKAFAGPIRQLGVGGVD